MEKTILICGYGPGVSSSIAKRFGKEGYACALVGRNADRLATAVAELGKQGVTAHAFPADLADVAQVKAVVGSAREKLGAIAAIQWSAYAGGAGDVTTAPAEELTATLGLATTSLVTAVQAALPDLKAHKGAVLVTNGGLGFYDPQVDKMGVDWNCMGLSMANAAKHKLCALLAIKLAPDVFVGEVMITGTVKGTPFDQGNGPTLDPDDIAAKFWDLAQARAAHTATI